MKRLLLVCSVILLLCGSAEAETSWMISPEGFVVGYDDLILKPEYPATGKWQTPSKVETFGTTERTIDDMPGVDWQTRQKIEEHNYREWVKNYQRWQKEKEQYWILIPPEQDFIKTKNAPVIPKNYHDWHMEEAR